jgi:leucyl-tRNA synthetase
MHSAALTHTRADSQLQEIRTCDPDFYKHTQRIFLMLHERGLAYQAESLVNYDPVDKTVLANEQVDANGCSWRSGAKVEKVMLKQWFLKITEYQDSLLDSLKALGQDGAWPEKVLAMQKNWIGMSEGTKLSFDMESKTGTEQFDPVDVFTTRADTLFGVQYLALSLTHPIVKQQALGDASLRAFIEQAKDLPPDSKDGYLLLSIIGRNPIAELIDGVDPIIPVYVAPYVLDDYGSGAVMGVPGHDTRDHAFWRANASNGSIKVVVTAEPGTTPSSLLPGSEDKPLTKRGYIAANINGFGGLTSAEAVRQVVTKLCEAGKRAESTKNWRLRDWLVSRQRYWGTPIPIIHCPSCGPVPVPEQDLPVKLPNLPDSFFGGKKGNPLAEDEHWKKTACPKCGSAAERETDTMDTFMDSSWYFFRFLDPTNETVLIDPQKADEGMPVDLYVGGVEHAILHLLYARFISKFLASTSTWPKGGLANGEPFKRLITQGMVHGQTFTDPENGRFLRPDELDLTKPSSPRIKANGLTPNVSYEKMSKSKYNGVDPGATIAEYGADATRAHMLFQAPVGDVLEWDAKKITGVQRWLQRVVKLSSGSGMLNEELARFKTPKNPDLKLVDILKLLAKREILVLSDTSQEYSTEQREQKLLALLGPHDKKLWIKTQRIIASVKESYSQTYSLNTIVSDLMTLTNVIHDTSHCSATTPYLKWYATAHLVRMMAPIAPGVAEEAWQLLTAHSELETQKHRNDDFEPPSLCTVFAAGFPTADLSIIPQLSQTVTCLVQVDGKRKFEVELESRQMLTKGNNSPRWVLAQLLETDQGKRWLDQTTGKTWELSNTKQPHPTHKHLPDDWQVIIAKNGRLCNLVSPQKMKAKKSDLDPATRARDTPVAVSYESIEKRQVTGLNRDSNEKSAAAMNKESTKGLNDSNISHLRKSTNKSLSVSALRKVHARIDTLMDSLPEFLRPRYAPPSILPVSQQAVLHGLRSVGLMPSILSTEEIAQYTMHLANLSTPPTIAPEYILTHFVEGDRPRFVRDCNVVFVDQIAFPAAKKLPYAQRSSIIQKVQRYRTWVNISVAHSELNAVNAEAERRMLELEMPGFRSAYQSEVKRWGKGDAQREIEWVCKIWQEIIALWAKGVKERIEVTPNELPEAKNSKRVWLTGGAPEQEEDPSNKEEIDETKDWTYLTGDDPDLEEEVGDWIELAGEDPNPKWRPVGGKIAEKKDLVPKWG